jgi:hypothetical protein
VRFSVSVMMPCSSLVGVSFSPHLDRGLEYYKVYGKMRTGILLIFVFSTFIIASANSASAETVTVTTKQNAIRESCKFFAPIKATVHYNDVLDVITQSGDWYQVTYKGIQGCIHKSAVEKKSLSFGRLDLSGGQTTSGEEVSLGGKGFNPQVEAAYARENPGLNFQAINTVEGYKVSDDKLINFIQSGKLNLE